MQAKAIFAVAIALAAAIAGVRWLVDETGGTDVQQSGAAKAAVTASGFDQTLPLEDRLRALEQAISDERYARQLLQDELFVLTSELDALTAERPQTIAADASARIDSTDAVRSRSRSRASADSRAARLVDAGFAPGQAEWILARESQLQMEALQARYDAERTGDAMNYFQSRTAAGDALRRELGDAEYERYLGAIGRPTSISVGSVLDSSPAQRAGLQPGDQIVRYAGKRIFGMSDLTRETMQGQPGEQVVVDVMRDGVAMQVVLPRGPIGISGGRRSAR